MIAASRVDYQYLASRPLRERLAIYLTLLVERDEKMAIFYDQVNEAIQWVFSTEPEATKHSIGASVVEHLPERIRWKLEAWAKEYYDTIERQLIDQSWLPAYLYLAEGNNWRSTFTKWGDEPCICVGTGETRIEAGWQAALWAMDYDFVEGRWNDD